jgi:hypothetical protein
MKKFILITIVFVSINFSIFAQEKFPGTINVDIDSLLTRYHLTGIKMIVNKVGVFSLKNKKLSMQRSDFDAKLLITLSRSVSLSENNFGAKFDYKFSDRWLIRGESFRRPWGQQTSINLLFQFEY